MSVRRTIQAFTQLRFHSRNSRRRRADSRRADCSVSAEVLNARTLLSVANDLAALNDEFDNPVTISDWQRIHETEGWNADQLNLYDVDTTQPGRMVQQPHTTVWYQNYRGPMAFKEVSGNFVFTTEVQISDRDDIGGSDADSIPGDALFSLGGVMIRTPRDITDPAADWAPGSMADDGTNNGENYVFLSLGYAQGANQFSLEVKTTRNSDSQLQLTALGPDADTAQLQIARIDDAVITLYRLPGEDWQVHNRYLRPDLPETMQVGFVTYSDWNKASDFDPFIQNSTTLTPDMPNDPTPGEPFNPDLTAGFEYARFARPNAPDGITAQELVNTPNHALLLSFLGEAAGDQPTEIEDQTISHNSDPIVIELNPLGADGGPAEYSVEIIGDTAWQLHEAHQFLSTGSYHENWGGLNERWIRGNEGWYYLLPDGEIRVWQGSFEQSAHVGQLTDRHYADPSLVTDPVLPVTAAVSGADLIITPIGNHVGTVSIQLSAANGISTEPQVFAVTVTNDPPVLESISNLQMAIGSEPHEVLLQMSDADGDVLQVSADFLPSETEALNQKYDFYSAGSYYQNWGGLNEKWIRSANQNNAWYYLLEDGTLNRWQGSFESSEQTAVLGAEVWSDPTLLTEANVQPIADLEIIGSTLRITVTSAVPTSRVVRVSLFDGLEETYREFTLTVI